MADFLSRHLFDIFSSLISILIPTIIYSVNKRRKGLTYESLKPRVENGDWYWQFKFTNTGYVPINPEDFEEPITFVFKSADVLSAEISQQSSQIIRMNARIQEYPSPSIELSKRRLNPNEWFILSASVRGSKKFSVHGRIAGLSKINLDAFQQYYKFAPPVLPVFYLLWVLGNIAILLLPTLISTKILWLILLNLLSLIAVERFKGWYFRRPPW